MRRTSLNDEPLIIATVDDSLCQFDPRSSVKTLTTKPRTSSKRYRTRSKTAKKKYRPSIRDMTITDRSHTDFFGIQGYKAPRNNVEKKDDGKTMISSFNRAKIVSMFSVRAEETKKLPGPTNYSSVIKWDKKVIKGGFLNKTKKVTMYDEAINKSKESPGVGKYKWNKPFKLRGYSRERSRRITFIDEIKIHGKEIPGHKYIKDVNTKEGKYKFGDSFVLKNSPNYSFRKMKKNKGRVQPSSTFIKEENGLLVSKKVSPMYYKANEAFLKTQKIVKNKYKFDKNKEKRYFDKILDNKKGIPGVGHYKNLERAKDKFTSRPVTCKGRSTGRK